MSQNLGLSVITILLLQTQLLMWLVIYVRYYLVHYHLIVSLFNYISITLFLTYYNMFDLYY